MSTYLDQGGLELIVQNVEMLHELLFILDHSDSMTSTAPDWLQDPGPTDPVLLKPQVLLVIRFVQNSRFRKNTFQSFLVPKPDVGLGFIVPFIRQPRTLPHHLDTLARELLLHRHKSVLGMKDRIGPECVGTLVERCSNPLDVVWERPALVIGRIRSVRWGDQVLATL